MLKLKIDTHLLLSVYTVTYPLMSQWDTPETQQSTRGPRSGTQGIGRNLYSVTIRYPHMLVNIPVFIRISMVMVFKSQSNLFTIKTASSAGYSSMNLYYVCWKNSLVCHHCKCPPKKKTDARPRVRLSSLGDA